MMDADLSQWFAGKSLSTDWTSRYFPVWASLLASRRDEALDVLEIGSWEGRSAIFFLRYLRNCRLTCIDTFSGSPEHAHRDKWADQLAHIEDRFDANLAEFGDRVEKIKGVSSNALARLVAEERGFDLVYVDGSHHSADVQADAAFSWPMVRAGGIIIFDDYEWSFFAEDISHPKLGVDTFLAVHAGQYRELYRGYQLIIQKLEAPAIESSRLPAQPVVALRQEPAPVPGARDHRDHDVEFVLVAEAGILEAQALLLCESIRCFAGAYSHCPIVAVSPRSSRRPSPSTLRQFEQLGVEYLPIEVDSCCPQYGTSYRIHALAHVERRPGPPVIIQLDSDTIFVAEPDFSLGTASAAARPVDGKGMCTTGPGDPFDAYWRDLCALAGVDYGHIPIIRTIVDDELVRASYNGGLVAAKRACGLFQRTEDIFRQLVAADMRPWAGNEPILRTGTGLLRGTATAFWGTSQAAFSLAAVAGNHAVRVLPDTHNFPLPSLHALPMPDPERLVHIHYHALFNAGSGEANPVLDRTLKLPVGIAEWLEARLPLGGQSATAKPEIASSRRTAILVLGMHRSGTSALGGIIAAHGAKTPKHPLPASLHNPKGYWESTPLSIADDNLLVAAASFWHDWLPLDGQWLQSPAAERFRHIIKAIILSEFGDAPLFFIKDPRICRFLPFMTSILADLSVDPVAFLPVRNPLEVAYSLQQRDQMALPTTLMLWLRHVLDAEYHSRNMPRCILRHEDLLSDWRHHMDRAAKETGIAWPITSDQADTAIAEFLNKDLHHQRASVADLQSHPDVTPLVRSAYAILRSMASEGDSQDLRDELDQVRVTFDESCNVVGKAVAAGNLAAQRLQGELGRSVVERDALAHAQQKLIQAQDSLIAKRDALSQSLQELIQDRDGVRAERDALSQSRQDLVRSRDSVVAERDALARTCGSLAAERDAVFASRSWRLTAPLRWVVTFIRRR